MPEGDTLFRTAAVLRRALAGEAIRAARGRPGGAQLERLVGARVTSVTARGKHLLIDLDDGLTLHSHLGMTGSWHRYARGEPWRRPASGLVALLETDRHVVVCFDAPVLELLEHRALELHPALAGLGPDLLGDEPDLDAAVARLLDARRARLSIGEALLDQTAVAGLGNVYRSEILFIERLDPFVPGRAMLPPDRLVRLLEGGRDLLRANTGGGDRVTMPDALGARPEAPAGLRPAGRTGGSTVERVGPAAAAGRSSGPAARPATSPGLLVPTVPGVVSRHDAVDEVTIGTRAGTPGNTGEELLVQVPPRRTHRGTGSSSRRLPEGPAQYREVAALTTGPEKERPRCPIPARPVSGFPQARPRYGASTCRHPPRSTGGHDDR